MAQWTSGHLSTSFYKTNNTSKADLLLRRRRSDQNMDWRQKPKAGEPAPWPENAGRRPNGEDRPPRKEAQVDRR